MKRLFILILVLIIQLKAQAFDKVVYGEDNRREIYQIRDNRAQELAFSVAAMFNPARLREKDGHYEITAPNLYQAKNLCNDEDFLEQPAAASCTGFLVGPDTLVTAGHCAKSVVDCMFNKWVFDYQVDGPHFKSIPASNVYSCKKIIVTERSDDYSDDFAVIQLDREVVGRTPLKFRSEGKIEDNSELFVIGHPTGLPAKIAFGGKVELNNKESYFDTALDTFGGNSGAPIFNAKTYEVEGILVRGSEDYIYNKERKCREVFRCSQRRYECSDDSICKGEDATRITRVPLLKILAN